MLAGRAAIQAVLRTQRRQAGRQAHAVQELPSLLRLHSSRVSAPHGVQVAADAQEPTLPGTKLSRSGSHALLQSVASDLHALQMLYQSLVNDAAVVQNFEHCMSQMLQCHERQSRVYVTGMGKSGAVAQRLASTLSSVSISSQWIHGGEWVHGELGGLKPGDMVILISNSGRTDELLQLPELFQDTGCCVLSIVGDRDSPLAQKSDLSILAAAEDEAGCPVPSRSIVVQEAVCNAIVQHLLATVADAGDRLRQSHPGGSIGANFANDHKTP